MSQISLSMLILKQYLRSALVPVLTIEILLLLLYFAISTYINGETEKTLKSEVEVVLPHLATLRAREIGGEFANIARQTGYFAEAHSRVLGDAGISVPKGLTFALAPTGALYQTTPTTGSSLYFTRGATLTPAQLEKARRTASLDPLYTHMVRDTPHVVAAYFNTPDNMNRLFPFIPEVWKQYPADLTMTDYNFYYLADRSHNPEGKPVWTGAYLDPAGNGWMISCVAPVSVGKDLAGVVGLDVTIKTIADSILTFALPWQASAFLADADGMILAMPPAVEDVLGLKELKDHVYSASIASEQLKPENYSLLKSPEPTVQAAFQAIFASPDPVHEITLNGQRRFVVQAGIPETKWRLFLMVAESDLFASVVRVQELAAFVGAGAVALMVVFYAGFFVFLRHRAGLMAAFLTRPLSLLGSAVSQVGQRSGLALEPSGVAELDSLTASFNTMVTELDHRNQKLIENEVRLRTQEKDIAVAFSQGQFEAASGYLHNIGNSVTALDSASLDLEEVIRGMQDFPEVFRRLKEEHDPGLLDRLETLLGAQILPRVVSSSQVLGRTRAFIWQTIDWQKQSLQIAGSGRDATEFSVSELLLEVCNDYRPAASSCVLQHRFEGPGDIRHFRNPLQQGLINVVRNALEASRGQGSVLVTLRLTDLGVRITVEDEGIGIERDALDQIMTPGFTTKEKGHGLGLHSFSVFLAAYGGRLTIQSPGRDQGTVVTVEVKSV